MKVKCLLVLEILPDLLQSVCLSQCVIALFLFSLVEVTASGCPHLEDKTFLGVQSSSLLPVDFLFPVTLVTKLLGNLLLKPFLFS